jgi:hypothetical protein
MRANSIQICHYKSDHLRGQFLDLLRFVKNELRSIDAAAMEEHQAAISKLAEDAVQALEELWKKAIQCKDSTEPFLPESGAKLPVDIKSAGPPTRLRTTQRKAAQPERYADLLTVPAEKLMILPRSSSGVHCFLGD